mmetsp:Transcript_2238/g.4707  ORF Transcript_2238/g.4707 Transcript_2238/m.4707 type:complete len:310 (+) Transcript_2238:59-988(+)
MDDIRERALTDDEDGGSEGKDSDYGLSDQQLEDLWQQVKDSGPEVRMSFSEENDAIRGRDSDFGLSERQIEELRQRQSQQQAQVGRIVDPLSNPLAPRAAPGGAEAPPRAAPVTEAAPPSTPANLPVDPLSRMAHVRKLAATDQVREPAQQKALPAKNRPEKFLEEQLAALKVKDVPGRRPGGPEGQYLKIHIISGRDLDGVTFYLLRVSDKGGQYFFTKRYSQFKAFDDRLRQLLPYIQKEMPPLPDAGLLGLRHRAAQWGFGDFNEKRLEALRVYVRGLSRLGDSLADVPLLEDFFRQDSPDRIVPK